MTKAEYLEQIAAGMGVDTSSLPDRLLTTYLDAILAAVRAGGGGGSSGNTGGSGAKLYRHDIELYDDDMCYSVYFTIFNTDSTNYTSELEFDYDEAAYIGEHPEGVYDFIPNTTISANGCIVDSQYPMASSAYSVLKQNNGNSAYVCGTSYYDNVCYDSERIFDRTWGQIYDKVTQIL